MGNTGSIHFRLEYSESLFQQNCDYFTWETIIY